MIDEDLFDDEEVEAEAKDGWMVTLRSHVVTAVFFRAHIVDGRGRHYH